jgi:hypothetical protein
MHHESYVPQAQLSLYAEGDAPYSTGLMTLQKAVWRVDNDS